MPPQAIMHAFNLRDKHISCWWHCAWNTNVYIPTVKCLRLSLALTYSRLCGRHRREHGRVKILFLGIESDVWDGNRPLPASFKVCIYIYIYREKYHQPPSTSSCCLAPCHPIVCLRSWVHWVRQADSTTWARWMVLRQLLSQTPQLHRFKCI